MIPLAALDQHIAILGKVGSGKTYAAKGLVEQLLGMGRRVCVIDPTGAWWGLRSSADGAKAGFPVTIFGGEHGDLPIAKTSGAPIAELIATRNLPCVIDLSELLIGDRHAFMEDFASTLHRLNRQPLHLVIDEADEAAPQNPLPETRRMLHQVDRIVRRGRIRGFRVMLITQRPAVLHKNVLTQANSLIVLRLTAPQDRKALLEWVKGQADERQGAEVLASLSRLQRGEGWVWSPEHDILERIRFPAIKTFDSSRAPELGDEGQPPATLAQVDLAPIRAALADAEREAAENDPRALKARIRELEAIVQSGTIEAPATDTEELDRLRADNETLASMLDEMEKERDGLKGELETERAGAEELRTRLADIGKLAGVVVPITASAPTVSDGGWRDRRQAAAVRVTRLPTPSPRPRVATGSGEKMAKAERLVLTALAQYPQGRSKTQVAILSGYAVTGGGFNNALSACRSQGWIEGAGDHLAITDSGLRALGSYEPLPHGRALLAHWLANVGKAERMVLEAVAKAWPRAMSKEEVAAAAGYEASGGGFNNALSRLRTLELISRGHDIRASDSLFDRMRAR